jgi:hypothetical protein
MIPALVGAGIGIIGSIGKMIGRGKANKQMEGLLRENPVYAANPLAQQRLGLAQTLLNARAPGAAAMERNIYQNQANTLGGAARNATDGSQLLALGMASQAQTNNAFENLQQNEAQDYQQRLGNVFQAQEGVIREGDKVFQDGLRRYGDKVQIRGAQNANKQANWGDVSNFGFGLANFGMSGGFGGMGKGGGGNNKDAMNYALTHPFQLPG